MKTRDFLALLGLLFIGLKLGGAIDWSWGWVLLPFYGGLLAVGLVFLVIGAIAAVFYIGDKCRENTRKR